MIIIAKKKKKPIKKPTKLLLTKDWKSLSYDEKLDLNDKIYTDSTIQNLETNIEFMERDLKPEKKKLLKLRQKNYPKITIDTVNKRIKLHEKDVKKSKDLLTNRINFIRNKLTKQYLAKKRK